MDKLIADLRYSVRMLAKNRSFAVVAVFVLALGIGATTAIFSVVNAVLLRPLPYQDPSRLVAISTIARRNGIERAFPTVTLNEVERWRADSQSIDSIGSFVFTAIPVNVGSRAMFEVAVGADPEFLSTLGIQPALGRNLSGAGSAQKDSSVIISHRFWVDAFASDPNVIGRSVVLAGAVSTVIGVLPTSFQFPRSDGSYFSEEPDLIFPVANIADGWGRNTTQWFAFAHLKPGISIPQATAEFKTITARMAASDPSLRGLSVQLSPLDAATTATVRSALLLSLGISIVLLLIACTNVMNLLFSRAARRSREIAIRKAVGATAWRLVRQMVTESAFLTFLAGAIGIVLVGLTLDSLVAISPAHLPISGRVQIDWTVLAFTFAICAVASMLAGILPAVHRSRQTDTLISGSRSSASRGVLLLQRGLMVSQIALGVGLLAAGGLLTHSMFRLSSVDPGFRTKNTIAFEVAFPNGKPADSLLHSQRVLDATRSVPGVISAGWITNPPPETRAGMFIPFKIVGAQSAAQTFCNFQVTSEDYFVAAGIALSDGRDFTPADGPSAPRVAIINETLARQDFPHENPLGKSITVPMTGTNPIEIVGIIHDIHDRGLGAKSTATVFVPYRQTVFAYGGVVARIHPTRAGGSPESVIPEIRRRIAAADPTVPLRSASTIEARVNKTLDTPRFYTIMAVACAFMAILFVTLGLYGLISYAVSCRTSEIGIRIALGASREKILKSVLWEGLGIAAIGVVLGLALSFAATRLLASLLFEIKPIDPVTLSFAAALVILVTLVASYFPAHRASRVHPMIALRHE